MLNQTVLVGRLVEQPTLVDGSAIIKLAIPRSYKNENGEYDTDFINAMIFGGVATNTCEYCKKGDLVGVKGRLQSNENGFELIAEKITFLSSNPNLVNKED